MFIVITGPTGVGKSTVSKALAKELPRSVNVDLDTIKHFVVGGFRYDESEEGHEQWTLLGKNAAGVVRNFLKEGYTVVANGMVSELTWDEILRAAPPNVKVRLHSDPDVNVSRDMQRDGPVRLGKKKVMEHHDYFADTRYFDGFTEIDTSAHSVEETVREILALI